MHRQDLFCACSPLDNIVGRPYCMFGTYEDNIVRQTPFDDFSIIPNSMHKELFAAVKQNGKAMEINVCYFGNGYCEAWKRSYAEFTRGAFEVDIPIFIGTDCHSPEYSDPNSLCAQYLMAVGFIEGDFSIPRFGKRK